MSPGILVAGLIVLIAAQATRLLAPARGHFVLALLAAGAGLLAGELVALSGHGGPTLGAIHPLADVPAIGVAEAVTVILAPRHGPADR